MKWVALVLILGGVSVGFGQGANHVTPRLEVAGVTYHNVRWGPVNQGKVVLLHSRGSAMVPVTSLPVEYQQWLAAKSTQPFAPPPTGRGTAPTPAWPPPPPSGKVRINGEWVEKSQLKELVGFVKFLAEATEDQQVMRGVILELAELRNPDRPIPANLVMRPGLWKPTGEQVLLKHYAHHGQLGDLIRVYGREDDAIKGVRAFVVGVEASR